MANFIEPNWWLSKFIRNFCFRDHVLIFYSERTVNLPVTLTASISISRTCLLIVYVGKKMEIQTVNTRRKVLNHAVCSILMECGYENCDKQVLETLTEMMQSFIVELGESARNFCELSGRTEPLIADIVLSLVNMGVKLEGLDSYGKRQNRTVLPQLQQQTQSKQLNILQAGVKQGHPSHIPNYLPQFPDPHAYIRTPTHKQPVTEYEAIREKAATQKRDIERALTRFIAKTGETHSLFLTDDNSMFPLVACKPQFPAYLSALLPQDQIFEPDQEFHFEPSPVKKKKEAKKTGEDTEEAAKAKAAAEANEQSEEASTQQDTIDNPYLRPGKIPKTKAPVTGPTTMHPAQNIRRDLSDIEI